MRLVLERVPAANHDHHNIAFADEAARVIAIGAKENDSPALGVDGGESADGRSVRCWQ